MLLVRTVFSTLFAILAAGGFVYLVLANSEPGGGAGVEDGGDGDGDALAEARRIMDKYK